MRRRDHLRGGGGSAPLNAAARQVRLELSALRHAGLVRPLIPVAMFELGNVATTLLILPATQLLHAGGLSLTGAASLAILLYAGHNGFGAVVAYAGGHAIDHFGPRMVFGLGAVVYLLAYGGFSLGPQTWPPLLAAFILAGSGIGLAEAAESAFVARLLPDHLRGSGFGVLGVQSAGDLLSSGVVGLLYAAVSPAPGFGYAAAWMLFSAVAVGTTSLLSLKR